MNNLELWNKVQKTPKEYMKRVAYGKRKFISIDATFRKKNATAMWGSYGDKWGLSALKWSTTIVDDKTILNLDALFFYPMPNKENHYTVSFEVSSDMPLTVGGECRKKLRTDVLTKALADLGFNADVYLGHYDDELDYKARRKQDSERNTAEEFDEVLEGKDAKK